MESVAVVMGRGQPRMSSVWPELTLTCTIHELSASASPSSPKAVLCRIHQHALVNTHLETQINSLHTRTGDGLGCQCASGLFGFVHLVVGPLPLFPSPIELTTDTVDRCPPSSDSSRTDILPFSRRDEARARAGRLVCRRVPC